MSEEECEQYEEHLLICESCQTRVTEMDQYVSAMTTAGRDMRRQPLRPNWQSLFAARWTPMLAAAAFAIMVAAVGVRWGDRTAAPAPVAVTLQATRGLAIAAKAPAGHPVRLALDLSDLAPQPAYRVTVVDRSGEEKWNGALRAANPTVEIPRMNAGLYFVRVFGAASLLREYGLEVTEK